MYIEIPKKFYSDFSHSLMTAPYQGDYGEVVDITEIRFTKNPTLLPGLSNEIQEYHDHLLSYPEFLQAVLENNQKLLNEKNYTKEHLEYTNWNKIDADCKYTTIVDIALMHEHVDLAKRFIEEGALISSSDCPSSSYDHPIFKSIKLGALDIVKLLCEKDRSLLKKIRDINTTPLQYACMYGEQEIAQYLISIGADVYEGGFENTSLHCAIDKEHAELALWLLQNYPKLADYSFAGHPLVTSAVRRDMISVTKALLDLNQNIDERDCSGGTALFYAVQRNNVEMVEFLIQRNANVNTKDNDDETLFHTLIRNSNNPKILKLLMDAGASVLVKNKDGLTPMALAEQLGKFYIKKLLQEYLVKSTEENPLDKQAREIENRYFLEKAPDNLKKQEEIQKQILKTQKQILAKLDSQQRDIEELKKQQNKNENKHQASFDVIMQDLNKIKTSMNTLQENQKDDKNTRKRSFGIF